MADNIASSLSAGALGSVSLINFPIMNQVFFFLSHFRYVQKKKDSNDKMFASRRVRWLVSGIRTLESPCFPSSISMKVQIETQDCFFNALCVCI